MNDIEKALLAALQKKTRNNDVVAGGTPGFDFRGIIVGEVVN